MKVKLNQGMAGPKMNVRAGAVVDLPDALAAELLESKQASAVDAAAPVKVSQGISELVKADAPPVEVTATAPAVPPLESLGDFPFDRTKLVDAKEGE